MRLRALFDLFEDAQDVVAAFDKVETPEQMVSQLERLKKQGANELLEAISSLRMSIESGLQETLEMGGTVGGETDGQYDEEGNGDLDKILEEFTDEEGNSTDADDSNKVKS